MKFVKIYFRKNIPIQEFFLLIIGNFAKLKTVTTKTRVRRVKTPADFRMAAEIFKALGNPNRLLIVDALATKARCVADLTERVGLDMSTVSNHLSVLRNVGIVKHERHGTQIFYRLAKKCVLNVFHCLKEFQAKGEE